MGRVSVEQKLFYKTGKRISHHKYSDPFILFAISLHTHSVQNRLMDVRKLYSTRYFRHVSGQLTDTSRKPPEKILKEKQHTPSSTENQTPFNHHPLLLTPLRPLINHHPPLPLLQPRHLRPFSFPFPPSPHPYRRIPTQFPLPDRGGRSVGD